MEINRGILVAQLVNFGVILWLFKKFLGDKMSAAIVHRRAELAKAADASKVYEETLAQAEQEKKVLIDEGVAHKAKLIEEAQLTAQQKADTIIAGAEKQAASIERKADEKAAKLEKELKDGFVDGVKHTAGLVVKKLFTKDTTLQEKYLDELVTEFAK